MDTPASSPYPPYAPCFRLQALSGLPVYTANLMALSTLRLFAIPAVAFLETTGGVWTKPLYRLRSRARVVDHGWRAHSGRTQHRPSTASGVDSARFLGRKWSRCEQPAPLLVLIYSCSAGGWRVR